MAWIRNTTLALSALAMATGGLAATTTTAAAVGGCPSGKLCLYEYKNYNDLKLTSTSTKACFLLGSSPYSMYPIGSYVNNLSVNAAIWEYNIPNGFKVTGTIGPGKFSSDTGGKFGINGAVCMGGLNPNVEFNM